MVVVGQKAPDFRCDAVIDGKIKQLTLAQCKGKYTILFFYPLDFTFVCPTELHAFQNKLTQFKTKQTDVLAISIDSVYSHLAWLTAPKANGGIAGITYPILSDINKTISHDYGVLCESKGVALRGLFLLDKDNVIQHISINNLGLGRNVDEALRLIDALQHHEKCGEVCPANWTTNDKALVPTQEGLTNYFSTK